MNRTTWIIARPLMLCILLLGAFAAGILVERLGPILAPSRYPPPGMDKTLAPFWETWHAVDRYYVDREAVDPQRMTRAALSGMIFSLGDYPHTRYLTPEEVERLKKDLEGKLDGIGASISMRNKRP